MLHDVCVDLHKCLFNTVFRCRAACKDFPNFKSFKLDPQRRPKQPLPNEQQQQQQQRTANINKFSSLGRRPLPQPPTSSVETPLNVNNFRSLQRTGWPDGCGGTSTFRCSGAPQQQQQQQFRSLQRGATTTTTTSVVSGAPPEGLYANSESERQLYAVTEL